MMRAPGTTGRHAPASRRAPAPQRPAAPKREVAAAVEPELRHVAADPCRPIGGRRRGGVVPEREAEVVARGFPGVPRTSDRTASARGPGEVSGERARVVRPASRCGEAVARRARRGVVPPLRPIPTVRLARPARPRPGSATPEARLDRRSPVAHDPSPQPSPGGLGRRRRSRPGVQGRREPRSKRPSMS
jgi:hypothetical protein